MHRKSTRSHAHLGVSLGLALCLFVYGGGVALAAPPPPRSTPQYVLCSSTISKVLRLDSTEFTVSGKYTYTLRAYVLGKYDARQPSQYCGPLYGEAEVVNSTTGSAPGGLLKATLKDLYSIASTSASIVAPSLSAFGDAARVYTAGESWRCAKTTAEFTDVNNTLHSFTNPYPGSYTSCP